MNREVESASMRPLAKTLTHHLDSLRSLLREQCFRNQNQFTEKVSHHVTLLTVTVSSSMECALFHRISTFPRNFA